jgi:hypothetical protein
MPRTAEDVGRAAADVGERIRRRWGDHVERAVRILNLREESSRALIQLVAPREAGRYKVDERDLIRGSSRPSCWRSRTCRSGSIRS